MIIIGERIETNGFSNLVLIGDDLVATENDIILIGETLFGKPVPES